LQIQKNSNEHAENIHNDALENAYKMQLEQFKFERNRLIEQRLRYFQTYYELFYEYMDYLDAQKYTQNYLSNVYEGFDDEEIIPKNEKN
jgi:hypothetical protein